MASGFNYLKSQRTADKLIVKFGGKLKGSIVRPTAGSGPRSNPGRGVPQEIPCSCVAVDYTVEERSNTDIQVGTKRILISPLGLPTGFDLQPTDKVRTADGLTFSIVPPVGKFKPTNILLFYDCQGKEG